MPRAVSVLLAAVCHGFSDSLPGGFPGVGAFVVTSRELITHRLRRDPEGLGDPGAALAAPMVCGANHLSAVGADHFLAAHPDSLSVAPNQRQR